MVYQRRFYEMAERETARISPFWKVFHVFTLGVISVSGFIEGHTFGKVLFGFSNNCFLHAHVVFMNTSLIPNSKYPTIMVVDKLKTTWGEHNNCNFCQFAPIMSMLVAFIWAVFFIICAKGGSGYTSDSLPKPWRIVFPAIVFAMAFSITLLISSWQLSDGVRDFCAGFESVTGTPTCSDKMDVFSSLSKGKRVSVNYNLKVAIACSYISFIGWVVFLASLLLRVLCVVDFQLWITTVRVLPMERQNEEQVVNVVKRRSEAGTKTDDNQKTDNDRNTSKETLVDFVGDQIEHVLLAVESNVTNSEKTSRETENDLIEGEIENLLDTVERTVLERDKETN